jgi:hypothetical protein
VARRGKGCGALPDWGEDERCNPEAPRACRRAAAIVAIAVGSGGAAASPTAQKSACKQAKNVEAIIDDSGSMFDSDPSKFRTSLLSAFANLGSNNGWSSAGSSSVPPATRCGLRARSRE